METDSLQMWAMIKSELKAASAVVLEKHGLDWNALNELENEASILMGDKDTIDTEFGTVQKIPDKPIQFRIRKSNQDTDPTMFKTKLRLTIREKHVISQ